MCVFALLTFFNMRTPCSLCAVCLSRAHSAVSICIRLLDESLAGPQTSNLFLCQAHRARGSDHTRTMRVRPRTHTHTRTYAHTLTHAQAHTLTHRDTHTHTQRFSLIHVKGHDVTVSTRTASAAATPLEKTTTDSNKRTNGILYLWSVMMSINP